LPSPNFAADYVLKRGNGHQQTQYAALAGVVQKILISLIGCELGVELASSALSIQRMCKSLHVESCAFQLGFDFR
jgi:hypothetical protein